MFGEYAKSLRVQKNIGSRELANKINKGSSYISQVENGRNKNPDYNTARLILNCLGLLDNQIKEILLKYNITEPQQVSQVDNIKSKLLTNNEFEEKCRQDALGILNVINNFPKRTKEILLELL